MFSRSMLPLLALVAIAACENPAAPKEAAGRRAHRTECVTRDITEDCDRTSSALPIAGGWMLHTVNGHPVTDQSLAQGYSFRASSSDPYNVLFVVVDGWICISPAHSFSLFRTVWALWDTYPLEEAPGYGGYLTTNGTATFVEGNMWNLGGGLTAYNYGSSLDVVFGAEGSPVYNFINLGAEGAANCASGGYNLTPSNVRHLFTVGK